MSYFVYLCRVSHFFLPLLLLLGLSCSDHQDTVDVVAMIFFSISALTFFQPAAPHSGEEVGEALASPIGQDKQTLLGSLAVLKPTTGTAR